MRWLFGDRAARDERPAALRPEDFNGCPDCGAIEYIRVAEIRGARRGGMPVVIGERCACQRCPAVYSRSLGKTFRQDRRSLPLTPSVPEPAERSLGSKDDETPPERHQLPPPRPRPRT